MINKVIMIVALVMMVIGSITGTFLMVYCMIKIIISDYKYWKFNRSEKDYYRQREDKNKNRKLTD
jgi:type III secretory pathway component EscV